MIKLKEQKEKVYGEIFVPKETTAPELAETIRIIAEKKGVPVVVTEDQATSGGLLGGEVYPCVVIRHPNPPQSYYEHWVVINEQFINIYYGGVSKAIRDTNLKNQRNNSGKLSGKLMNAVMQDPAMALQAERLWHAKVKLIYNEIWPSLKK